MVVALAFSGGGTRAAAFSFGVLTGFDETPVHMAGAYDLAARPHRLRFRRLRRLGAGGLLRPEEARGHGRFQATLPAAQRAGQSAVTNLSLFNIAKGLKGGVNDPTAFPKWLDANLYGGATFKSTDLRAAADGLDQRVRHLQSHTVLFDRTVTFSALCSDLSTYPISQAVAASAAVPVVFAPVVIQNFTGGCPNAAAGVGGARAHRSECRAADRDLMPTRSSAITPAKSNL